MFLRTDVSDDSDNDFGGGGGSAAPPPPAAVSTSANAIGSRSRPASSASADAAASVLAAADSASGAALFSQEGGAQAHYNQRDRSFTDTSQPSTPSSRIQSARTSLRPDLTHRDPADSPGDRARSRGGEGETILPAVGGSPRLIGVQNVSGEGGDVVGIARRRSGTRSAVSLGVRGARGSTVSGQRPGSGRPTSAAVTARADFKWRCVNG